MTKVSAKMTMSDHAKGSRYQSLMKALQKYLDMMYDCDTSRFDDVFRSTVHLHGFRDGEMKAWSADVYKEILNKRQSPKSQNAPREDEVLLVDFASPTLALVKVRLRVVTAMYVDYLTWHCIDGKWLITSKGYHIEAEPAGATKMEAASFLMADGRS
jgi:hypothetical protein